MNSVKKIDKNLELAIDKVVANKEKYVMNPKADFTRSRKLPMKDVLNHILSMGGGTLREELFNISKRNNVALTSSAFVQQRAKISSNAFKDILRNFNAVSKDTKTYHGYRLLAADGSDINCARNPDSPNYLSTNQHPKGFNQIHLNALFDICNHTYFDISVQPRKEFDERRALIEMLRENCFEEKTIIVVDRGYESYNMFANFLNTDNVDFICRVKTGSGAMFDIKNLPMEELDCDISFEVTTTQRKEDKLLGRRFIQTGSKKGKKNSNKTIISNWDFPSPYTLKLRVVRFLLDSGEYETLVTSLSRADFQLEEFKKLYHMRWDIETSFRDLKYSIGVTHLHSKKDDSVLQELYAAVIIYNYCSRISGSQQVIKQQPCKYLYKINFTMAIHICKTFYRSIKKDYEELVYDIGRHSEPVRPGRKDIRNLRTTRFLGFSYRVAA